MKKQRITAGGRKKNTNPWFVYLLECADGSIYTGVARDVEKRFRAHRFGRGAAYTRAHAPKKILYTEAFLTRGAALTREAAIKKYTRSEKLMLVKHSDLRA